jgi:hypothetical protein
LQVFDLDHAVRIFAFEEPRGLHREVLSVAVGARRLAPLRTVAIAVASPE